MVVKLDCPYRRCQRLIGEEASPGILIKIHSEPNFSKGQSCGQRDHKLKQSMGDSAPGLNVQRLIQ